MKPNEILEQHSSELVLYDRMRSAIAACERVDEVKEIRDKAHAIEVYAAQAQNYEAESQAVKIRLRAERRCGELIKERKEAGEMAKGAAGNPGGRGAKIVRSDDVTTQPTLADLGISKQQSSDWQKLAEIPEEVFEAKLNDSSIKPSTSELIKRDPPPGKIVTAPVIYVWGQICEFYKGGYLARDPVELFEGMNDLMQDDIEFVLPQLIPWLEGLKRRSSDEESERSGELVCTQPAA